MRLIDADRLLQGVDAAALKDYGSNKKNDIAMRAMAIVRVIVDGADTVDVNDVVMDTCNTTSACDECSFRKMCDYFEDKFGE